MTSVFLTPHTAPNGGAAWAAENKLSGEEENELFAALNISTCGKFQKIYLHRQKISKNSQSLWKCKKNISTCGKFEKNISWPAENFKKYSKFVKM